MTGNDFRHIWYIFTPIKRLSTCSKCACAEIGGRPIYLSQVTSLTTEWLFQIVHGLFCEHFDVGTIFFGPSHTSSLCINMHVQDSSRGGMSTVMMSSSPQLTSHPWVPGASICAVIQAENSSSVKLLTRMSAYYLYVCYLCETPFRPLSGVNTGGVGSYIYDDPVPEAQPWAPRLLPGPSMSVWPAFYSPGDEACALPSRDGHLGPVLCVVFVFSIYFFVLKKTFNASSHVCFRLAFKFLASLCQILTSRLKHLLIFAHY